VLELEFGNHGANFNSFIRVIRCTCLSLSLAVVQTWVWQPRCKL